MFDEPTLAKYVHLLYMEALKFVALRHRRRAGNPGNFAFHTEFPHTSHTASSSSIQLISEEKILPSVKTVVLYTYFTVNFLMNPFLF